MRKDKLRAAAVERRTTLLVTMRSKRKTASVRIKYTKRDTIRMAAILAKGPDGTDTMLLT